MFGMMKGRLLGWGEGGLVNGGPVLRHFSNGMGGVKCSVEKRIYQLLAVPRL